MMREEFEKLVGKNVSDEEYEVIEKVYTWHPAIKNSTGKQQIAQLYTDYGMSVIRGMKKVADYMMELDKERQEIRNKLEIIKKREEMLAEGDTSLEEMAARVRDIFMKCETSELFETKIRELRNNAKDLVDIAMKIADV